MIEQLFDFMQRFGRLSKILVSLERCDSYTKIIKEKGDSLYKPKEVDNIIINSNVYYYNEQNEKRFLEEIDDLNKKIQTSEEEMNNKLDKKNSLKQNKEKFEKELKEKQEELNKIMATFSEKELKIEEAKRKLENNVDKKYEIETEKNTQNTNILNIEKRSKQIEKSHTLNLEII